MAYKDIESIEKLLYSDEYEKIDNFLFRKTTDLEICYQRKDFYKLYPVYAVDARNNEYIIFYFMLTNLILPVPAYIARKIRSDISGIFEEFGSCNHSLPNVIKIKINTIDDTKALMEVLNDKIPHRIAILNGRYRPKKKGRM